MCMQWSIVLVLVYIDCVGCVFVHSDAGVLCALLVSRLDYKEMSE